MADPVWNNLAKSQIDPETIEEAIARLVAEHEASPTAHLGEGEALQAHRTNEVLDHLQGSVVPDKSSLKELSFYFPPTTTDGLSPYGSATAFDLRWDLYVESGVDDVSSLSGVPLYETYLNNQVCSFLLEFSAIFDQANASTAEALWTIIGFEIEDDRVRGFNMFEAFGTKTYTDWYTIDMTKLRTFRAVYFKNEEVARFYIDGDLIDEISGAYVPSSSDMTFSLTHTRNTASDNHFYVLGAKISAYER